MISIRFTFLITILVIAFGFLPVKSQTVIKNWTPEQMVDQQVVGSAAISPDGSMIAYTVRETKMEGEDSKFLTHIWVASADGSMDRQFTRGDHSVSNPQFTPDGRYLSFTSSRNGENQVYRMFLNGGEAEQITRSENGVGNYAWAPDGSRIAFTMRDSQSEDEKEREREKRDITIVDTNFKYSRIYVQHADDDSAKAIYGEDLHAASFDWSPDGSTIVFAHQPTPKIDDRYKMDISTVPADSGALSSLIDWDGTDSSPRFTPDGNSVVFTSHGDELEAIGLLDLYVVELSSGEVRGLAHTYDRNANIVGFDGNGHILVQEPRRTVSALYRVPLNGSEPILLNREDGIYRSFSVSGDGRRVVYTYQNSSQPAEVYFSNLSRFSRQKVSAIHDQSEFPEMGKTEVLNWTSEDGIEIEGLLTYPVGYEEGDRVPLILMVHGGPAGVYSQTWTGAGSIYSIQYFAENGYALLRPNPRGSTGYGKDFRYANFQDWGYGDFNDLMTGVDKVIDMGVADPDRLAEMGWSYGGYMTSWIVTQTDRFKAVSMGAGLSNLVSMVGTTDIPGYLLGHMGGPYWNGNMESYERHSAVYFMDNVTTPTQIIHGSGDLRVPLAQGQEFYWALQEKGVDTEMILLPRTGHGPTEPKLIAEVSTQILKWFDTYIER